jgi:hypothetical protein
VRNDPRDRRCGKRSERRSAIGHANAVERLAKEATELIPIQRFRRRQCKERMLQQARPIANIEAPAGSSDAVCSDMTLPGSPSTRASALPRAFA